MWIICFGIASYFKEQLEKILHKTPYFVALFDESYNAVSKNGQIDLHVRFWDSSENLVKTRYWTQSFWERLQLKICMKSLIKIFLYLKKEKKIQISSGRPNVNLAFLDIVNKNRTEEELSQLIHIGTCGLHMHGSFKCGENGSG